MPSRFSTKDVKRWRERLLHAKRVWIKEGLLGMGGGDSTLRMGLEMYRGNHYEMMGGWAGLHEDQLAVANKIYSTANAILARNASRNPTVQIFPRSPTAQEASPFVEALMNYDIHELKMKRVLNGALRASLFSPWGIVRHGFTPKEETFDKEGRRLHFYRAAKPDRPWIECKPIWECLWDPRSRGLTMDGGTKWVAFLNFLTVDQIERNPGMIARRDLRPTVSLESGKRLRGPLHQLGPDDVDLVEVYTVYEAEQRTWFQLTLDGTEDRALRESADWPIAWEWLPVNGLGVNEQDDSPFPVPILEQVIPLQVELNRVRTMMSILTRNLRRIVGVGQGVDEPTLNKLSDGELLEFFRVQGMPKEQIQEIQTGGFPQELLLYAQQLEQDIREMSGQSLMDRAQRINVESATEAANVQQGSDVLALRIQSAFEDFTTEVLSTYMAARRETMTEEEMVPLLGAQDAAAAAPVFLTVQPAQLHEEYDFLVVPGSMLSPDRDREAAKASADLQFAAGMPELHNLPYLVERYWQARGINPQKALTKPQERQQVREKLGGMQGLGQESNANGRGGGVDPTAFAFGEP